MSIEISPADKGKTIYKVLFPVFAGLILIILIERIETYFYPLSPERDGDGAMLLGYLFYRLILPFITVVLLLMQWKIILIIWGKILSHKNVLWATLGSSIIISLSMGALFAFTSWQRKFGTDDLLISFLFMSGMQLCYWIPNFATLYFLDRPYILSANTQI